MPMKKELEDRGSALTLLETRLLDVWRRISRVQWMMILVQPPMQLEIDRQATLGKRDMGLTTMGAVMTSLDSRTQTSAFSLNVFWVLI